MDELEISGKKFLSTRRAAKEHKYHADYIGQLIRGGKVVGKKVGRSWYVEAESLAAYLKAEPQKAKARKTTRSSEKKSTSAEAPQPAAEEREALKEEPEVEAPTPQQVEGRGADQSVGIEEEKILEPVVQEKVEEPEVREVHVPIRTRVEETPVPQKSSGGLRYIADDAPLLPNVERRAMARTVSVSIPSYDVVESTSEGQAVAARPRTLSFVALTVLGVVALSATAALSVALSTHVIIEEGQAASVSYTFR